MEKKALNSNMNNNAGTKNSENELNDEELEQYAGGFTPIPIPEGTFLRNLASYNTLPAINGSQLASQLMKPCI